VPRGAGFAAAIGVQDRAAPLVDAPGLHAADVAEAGLRTRIAALIARRNRTGEWLAEQMARVRQDLQLTQVAQRRVAQVAPAYGQGETTKRPQLCAVG